MLCSYGHALQSSEGWKSLPQNLNRIHLYYGENLGGLHYINDENTIYVKPGYIYFFAQNLGFKPSFVQKTEVNHEWIDFITVPLAFGEKVIEIPPDSRTPSANALRLCLSLARTYKDAKKDAGILRIFENALQLAFDCLYAEHSISLGENVRVNQALKYIHLNYASDITLDDLATEAYCAKNYLVRLFKKEIGVTPYQYIKNYRMGVASDYLIKGYTLKEIAKMVGYSDGYAFATAFYKTFGIYPSEYVGRIQNK